MPSVARYQLSGSTNGKQLGAVSTGTTLHTAASTTDTLDELHIAAQNSSINDVELILEIGGSSAPDTRTILIRSKEVAVWAVRGDLVLDNGVVVTAKVASAADDNAVVLSGYVNRIVQS